MKRGFLLLLALLAMLSLCACTGPAPTEPPTEPAPAFAVEEGFGFTLSGVTVYPGGVLALDQLPQPDGVTQIPSCANQGTDSVYNFGTVEITAFYDGTNEIVYSIYILDANTPTDLGLYLGDGLETVESLYGKDYTLSDGLLTFRKGNSSLALLLENEQIISIDHRWDFE